MDINQIQQLVEILEKSSLSEIELQEGENLVRLSRSSNNQIMKNQVSLEAISNTTQIPPISQGVVSSVTDQATNEPQTLNGFIVRSPMVGTFYKSSDPNEKPYAQIGEAVKKGDVLCIIEAMKMMNHIEAEQSGVIEKILVSDGQPVEYDQALFTII